MKLLFLIASCERPKMLRRLLWQIKEQCEHPYAVVVLDDGSESDYTAVERFIQSGEGAYWRLRSRNGKRGYYKTVSELFKRAKNYEFDFVFKLDDDVLLHPNAINWAVEIGRELNNRHKKVMLNMWVDHRAEEPVWTGIVPRKVSFGEMLLRRIGWIDGGNWMANRKTLETLNWECPKPPDRWWESAGDSSGVGKYLSVELSRKACRIYMPMEGLVFHGGHDSVMHPDKENRPISMKTKPWKQ